MILPKKKTVRLQVLVIVSLSLFACASSPEQKEAKFLKKGAAFVAAKDYSRAYLEFQNAVKIMPRDAEPFYQIGMVALALGDQRRAVVSFREASELNPKHAGAQLKLAEMMASTRDENLTEQAEKRLQQVLEITPDNAEAIDSLAITEALLGKSADGSKRLEDALTKFPAHLQSSMALARLKLAMGDTAGAEEALKKAVENAPKSPEAAIALGQFYLDRQKTELGEAQVRRALALDPKNPSALIILARVQVKTNRIGEAEETFKRISELGDKRYRPLYGLFLLQQNKREAALTEFKKLAERDSQDRDARTRLVAMYVTMNRTVEAERVLNQALKRNPKDTEALSQRAGLYLRAGKTTEAKKDLQQVLHSEPNSAAAHFALAEVERLQGSMGTERQNLTEALRLKPGLLAARVALARSFMQTKDAKPALDLLEQTPQAQKKAASVQIERNWALLLAGNAQEARNHVQEMLKISRVPDVVLQDGVIKLDSKDYAGARADAEEILHQDPDNARAARLLIDTYLAQKLVGQAVDRLHQMVSLRPQSFPWQMLLGQLTPNKTEARTAFEAASKAAPQFKDADLALAGLDMEENRLADAHKRLTAVIAGDARNERAQVLLGRVESKMGNVSGAIASYRLAVDINGSNLIALNNMAYLMAMNNPDEALKFAQKALELAPDNAAVQDTLGWVYYRKAIYQTATNYLTTAFQREPTPQRQFHLGMSHIKSGDKEKGAQMVQSALQKEPNLLQTERGW